MMSRSSARASLAELEKTPPRLTASCELSLQKNILQAFLYSRLEMAKQLDESLRGAERSCPAADPILAADVAMMKGQLDSDPARAESYYKEALAIARQQKDSFHEAAALLNLGNVTQSHERYDESIEWSHAALEIASRFDYKRLAEKAQGNLAFDYEKLGDFHQALSLYEQAEQSATSLDAGDDKINWRNNLGLVHEETGQLSTAEQEYRQALQMAIDQEDNDWQTVILGELALVSIRTEKWSEAESFSAQALKQAQAQANRPVELEALLAQGLVAAHRGEFKTAEDLLAVVARDPGHDRQSSRWEAQHLLANLYAQQGRVLDAQRQYEASLDTVRLARCSIHKEDLRMPFFANATRVYDSYLEFLVQRGKVAEALRIADESRALTLAEGLGIGGKKCLASEVLFNPQRAAKQAGATILFYWTGAGHSYLWAISPEHMTIYPLPDARELEGSIRSYRQALLSSRDVLQSGEDSGAKLYQALVAPAADFLHKDGRVILITDGSLSGLNFETLVAPLPQPHYWIEDVTLQNASSLRLLTAAPKQRHRRGTGLLLMGNSVPPGGAEFAALPKAAEEMQSVGKYFAASEEQVFDRANSTAEAYLNSHPEKFGYIHFVAHGTASLTDPLDSAVVLSPAKQDGGYKLYARDVITRPLNAELVTVSTCKGAGIRTYTGEGLVGLSWAFLHAGAHHVIGALWDVSDESTPQLMNSLYGQLIKGSSPEAALRAAKLSLLHSGTAFRKPYYWAAFQLYTGS